MKALQLDTRAFMKLVLVLGIIFAVMVLTGMTQGQISKQLLQILPPDLSALQGHAIFESLW